MNPAIMASGLMGVLATAAALYLTVGVLLRSYQPERKNIEVMQGRVALLVLGGGALMFAVTAVTSGFTVLDPNPIYTEYLRIGAASFLLALVVFLHRLSGIAARL